MKRKTVKKLVLNRETLIELDRSALAPVAAGYTYTACPYCPYSGENTCATCQATCTSNYC